MSELQPRGESLRKAVRFISQLRQDEPTLRAIALVDRATLRFDLNPAQGEWLLRFVREIERSDEGSDVC